ncbi:MAG: ABC transporter ATP-binding protein [Proteobacteria bacterium]|nr:ABC transporter ATP-binding protein [Pseudomonadota bacterium]
MSAIQLKNVSRQWGSHYAVNAASFSVREGAFAVLLGPSGCGKSTTLRLIAGLDQPTAGEILIADKDVTGLPSAQRNIAMVFQSYALFPHLSVAENILFGVKVRKEPAEHFPARLQRVAELLGLTQLLDRKPGQLSGGQQQRVALGRAIIAEKPVCLMDEPLSNLDAQLRHEMRREIRGLQQKLGITMVYVTHDQTEAMSMADQVVLLRDGRIEQDATPDELYARPATTFAARFIGTPPMNILRLADGPQGGVIAGGQGEAVCSQPGAGLELGVRPEHIHLAPSGGIQAKVHSSEYFGADTIVACSIGEQALSVRAPGKVVLAAGENISLAWEREAQHFFDAATGGRREDVI